MSDDEKRKLITEREILRLMREDPDYVRPGSVISVPDYVRPGSVFYVNASDPPPNMLLYNRVPRERAIAQLLGNMK